MPPTTTAGLGSGGRETLADRRHPLSSPAAGLDGPALIYGLAIIVVTFWLVNPTAFVTEDAYFYLVSARRFARGQGQTFSGIFPTNGFHPLWLYLLYGWASLCQLVRPSSLLSARFAVFPAAACFFWGTRQLLGLARTLRLSAALVAGVPMVFVGVMGVLGSEGHALYAAARTLLVRLAKGAGDEASDGLASDGKAIVTGLWAALVVLARLDSIFWIAAFGAWSLASSGATPAPRVTRRRLGLCLGTCVVALGPYLLSNAVWFGGLLPISGWMKSSFPRLRPVKPANSLLGAFRGYNNLFGHAPIVLGLLSYPTWARRHRLVSPLLLGCLGHDVYTSLFGSYSEWYWYYVLNVTLGALCLGFVAARLTARPVVASLVAVAVALSGLLGLMSLRLHSQLGRLHAFQPTKFLNDAGVRDQAVLVGDTPGYIAFYSEAEIVAADFLTGSRRTFETIAHDPNPLRALFRTYQQAGHPFAYVIWDENRWLGASSDWRTLRLFHPKNGRDGEPFGELGMPPPVLVTPSAVVWDVRGMSFDP